MVIDLTEQSILLEIFKSQNMTAVSALELVRFFAHLEKHKGIRFVCNYLKGLRSYLLKGEVTDQRLRRRADGSLCGCLLPLWKMQRSSRRGRIRVDRILRVYGRWEHPKPTLEDYKKFASSVREASEHKPGYRLQLPLNLLREGKVAARLAKFDFTLPYSAVKKTPMLGKRECETLPYEHYEVLSENAPGILARNGDIFNLLYPLYFAEDDTVSYDAADEADAFDENGILVRALGDNMGYPLEDLRHDIVGTVCGLTKDRGYKLRFIANPHRFIQLALSRLKNAFENVLRQMPESAVYDQGSGIHWAQLKLIEGRHLWSIDLSAATDNFPFSLQESVARMLFGSELRRDINLWRDVVHASWKTPVPFNPKNLTGVTVLDYPTVQYRRGQPMGVAPSFAAFTVSHIALLRDLGGNQETFKVLGDDVLICDRSLYEAYVEALHLLNVPISPTKSIYDGTVGEFAGRLVDKHGFWPVYKGSRLSIRSDPLGLVRQYGKRIVRMYPKLGNKQREVINFFSSIPGYGFSYAQSRELFDSLSVEQLEILYFGKTPTLLPLGDNVRITDYALCGLKPHNPVYEPRSLGLGFLGDLPQRSNRVLVEHLNANALDPDSEMDPLIRKHWSIGLGFAETEVHAWEEDPPSTWDQLYKIYKRVMRV